MAENEQIYAKIQVWIGRDLRTHDHCASYHALKAAQAQAALAYWRDG